MNIRKIEPFNYLKGTDFTENLKRLTGCKNFQEMAFVYDVPKVHSALGILIIEHLMSSWSEPI